MGMGAGGQKRALTPGSRVPFQVLQGKDCEQTRKRCKPQRGKEELEGTWQGERRVMQDAGTALLQGCP